MNNNILDNVAPCGLVCYTCNGCDHGIIKERSNELLHYLEGYDDYVFRSCPEDKNLISNCMQVLKQWVNLDCPGCRNGDNLCQNQNCVIRPCTREKGYDFCARCPDFPCDKVHEGKEFNDIWLEANKTIRESGIEAYFEEQRNKSQYTRYMFGKAGWRLPAFDD